MFISEVKESDYVEEFLRVVSVSEKTKKNGDPYKVVIVGDKTGTLQWNVWDKPDDLKVNEGDILFIKGSITVWNGTMQIAVEDIRVPEKDEIDMSKFIKAISNDQKEDYKSELKAIINDLESPWKQVVIKVFSQQEVKDKFFECPASIYYHENFLGGLLEHTMRVTQGVIARLQSQKNVDKDFAISLAILHDIGKIREYDIEKFVHSEEGIFKRHVFLGAAYLQELMSNDVGCGLTKRQQDLLVSGTLSSHGTKEFGSPVSPLSKEAYIVHSEDSICTKLAVWDEIIEDSKRDFEFDKFSNHKIFTGKAPE